MRISLFSLSLFFSVALASDPLPPDLVYVQIGAGVFGDNGFRTVFRLSNESEEAVEGTLVLTSSEGTDLEAELEATWTLPGELQEAGPRVDFSIPPGSTLRLTVIPGEKPSIGWARLSRSGALVVQTFFQYAEGLPVAGPLAGFEDHVIRQVESHPVIPAKSFAFPVSLYQGFQELNTAFAVVNLSAAAAEARFLLRPGNLETIRLPPGEIYANYYDDFWTFAVPEIFPLRLEQTASLTSAAPLGVAVFHTIQGLPLSGITVTGKTAEEGETVEATLGTAFELRIGQQAVLQAENLEIRFWSLPEDSRCPSDVTCVWEGQARILLLVGSGGEEADEIELISRAGQSELSRAVVDPYTIELVSVEPYPISTETIDLEDYRITLVANLAE